MAWIKRCAERNEPFFCDLATNAPHPPHIDEEKDIAPYRKPDQPAGFFGVIAHIDNRFGDFDQFHSDNGLVDETIVVVMTDNGGTAGVGLSNAGLRGARPPPTRAVTGFHVGFAGPRGGWGRRAT